MQTRRQGGWNISATALATCGAAMLVPLFVTSKSLPSPQGDIERAARIPAPGAVMSGFRRPSRVGPALLNRVIGAPDRRMSYAPTVMVLWPLHTVLVVLAWVAGKPSAHDLGQLAALHVRARRDVLHALRRTCPCNSGSRAWTI